MDDPFDPFAPDPEHDDDVAVREFTSTAAASPYSPEPDVEDPFADAPSIDPVGFRKSRIAGLTAAIAHHKDEIRHTGNAEQLARLNTDLAKHERELEELLAQPKSITFEEDPFQDVPSTAPRAARRKAR